MNYQHPIFKAASAERFYKSNEFIRIAKIRAASGGQGALEQEYAKKASANIQTIFQKAAANPLGLTSGISEFSDVVSAFLGSQKNSSFDTMLEAMQRVPLHSRVAIVTGGMTATTVGEGMIKPLSNFTLAGKALVVYKAVGVVVSTDEFFKLSDPAATALFGRELQNAISIETDTRFLALVTAGISPITSSGGAAANVLLDLDAAAAALDTDSASLLFVITTSDVAKKWAFKTTADGTLAFRNMTPQGGEIAGVPVLVSDGCPANSFVMLDAHQVAASAGDIELEASKQSTLQFETAPDSPTCAVVNGLSYTGNSPA